MTSRAQDEDTRSIEVMVEIRAPADRAGYGWLVCTAASGSGS